MPSKWRGQTTKFSNIIHEHTVMGTIQKLRPIICLFSGIMLGFYIATAIRLIVIGGTGCSQEEVIPRQKNMQPRDPAQTTRKVLFIGVMTANKFLDSRAVAIYETWGQELGFNIAFFSSESSSTQTKIPLIKLKGVDDSYPPQKKSFMMLQYMHDNLIDQYHYFMRADDDLYVKVDQLSKFLNALNSSEALYIGQPGLGLPAELGQLSLNTLQNYCMGGPGMIFSHTTLHKMGPHIPTCFADMKTSHEDVEIGRCVQRFAKCPCTWSYDMRNIFHHVGNGEEIFSGSLKQTNIEQAITLHPLKNPKFMYRMHVFAKESLIKDLETEIVGFMRELKEMDQKIGAKSNLILDDIMSGIFVDHLGHKATLQGSSRRDIIPWDYINKSVYSYKDANPNHRPTDDLRQGITEVVRDLMKKLDKVSNERGRILTFKEFQHGYHRLNPGIASQYIVDVLMLYKQYRGTKRSANVRRHAYMQEPFGPLYIREAPSRTREDTGLGIKSLLKYIVPNNLHMINEEASERITFILPLAGRLKTFIRFMKTFENVCLKSYQNVRLLVVQFRPPKDEQDTREKVHEMITALQWKYSTPLQIVDSNRTFARAEALEIGASHCEMEDLLFFIDVDMIFNEDALDRIRWHTILNKQVYYPIVYSEYDPRVSRPIKSEVGSDYFHFKIDNEVGYWRSFGYGIASIYKSDLRNVGGFDVTIQGWGGEDVDLFDKIIKYGKLEVMRAPDPSLVHVFHEVHCDKKLDEKQQIMCQKSLYSTYASSPVLTRILDKRPEILEGR